MIVTIANPIYDAIFKYLMEDQRIAKTVLSALLKKEVVKVEIRPHEYANSTKDRISMFRLDFAATIRDENGKESAILIELQKTWVETETLRFRQYLGSYYNLKDNVREENGQPYALPLVAIYILGHRVGDINEPILYVSHGTFDYNGNAVSEGIPNTFVESITHDSIIVQIPLLNGQINNRLLKVLSVFDQSNADKHNTQLMRFDEDMYKGDVELQYLLQRLERAALDARLRQDMNVEDEYYGELEKRDTQLMQREKVIAEQQQRLDQYEADIVQSIKNLRKLGLDNKTIAATLNRDISFIEGID
ncbi:MAG: hypothetical protein SPE05_08505 [Bacteroidales bacterium]|nr:hypothetical protein [Bacteroidales bacterium]